MPNRIFRTFFGALTFAAFMICGGPAQAVFYGSDFDPVGPVSFSGHGLFQFDDACLATPGLHSASSCHLMLVSASDSSRCRLMSYYIWLGRIGSEL